MIATQAYDLPGYLSRSRSRVQQVIGELIPKREPQRHLYEIVAGQLANEGKGMRPALCIATCLAFGGEESAVLPSATAIELLHNAFLIHDDIEDESEYRRGRPTLHKRYGIPLAINAGDALNALSVSALRRNLSLLGPGLSARIFDEFDHMTLETIEGQAMELGWIRDNDCSTTEDDYLRMVLKKTTWYSFIHPARIGAMIAQPQRDLDVFNRFGFFLGAAFQIQDDVLNLTGDKSAYGKEIGGDLLEGKRTLILTHVFTHANASERDKLRAFLGKPRTQRLPREVSWLQALIRERGSIEYASKVAQQLLQGARDELDTAYAGATPGMHLDFVRALLDFMLTRRA